MTRPAPAAARLSGPRGERHGVAQSGVPIPTIVIATRNRRERLLSTLAKLCSLPEAPSIVVVDNASEDDTALAVRRHHPSVELVSCRHDRGSAARTIGVMVARTPLVAFTDDDSWWEPGALRRAAALFEAHRLLGLIAARIQVEPGGALDPTCRVMRDSPLEDDTSLPGPPVLGFLACGAIARRSAVLACGGFHERYGFGGEEELLAVDMAAAGWRLAYVDDIVAHHEPAAGPREGRRRVELRNRLWSTWLRRPLASALRCTVATAARPDGGMHALVGALRGIGWVLSERRVVPSRVERSIRALEKSG